MTRKHDARAAYYHGAKAALIEHMVKTEKGLRSLSGMSEAEIDKIVASVHKRHLRILREVDRQFAEESAMDAL